MAEIDKTEEQSMQNNHHHHHDTNPRLTNILLNGHNYILWARAARVSLKGRGKLGYIDGSKPRPEKDTEQWDIVDSQVMTWITNSIEPKLSEIFCFCETAQELWNEIQTNYCEQNNFAQIFELKREISQTKQGAKFVSELTGYQKAKFKELETLRPITTDLKELKERAEQDMVYHFLTSLDSSYESFRAQLLISTEKPTFATVTAMAQREETRRRVMNDPECERWEAKACVAQTPSINLRGEARAMRALDSGSEACEFCKKVGHTRESCWHLHPHLRPNRGGNGKGSIVAARSGGRKGENRRRFGGLAENPRIERGDLGSTQDRESESERGREEKCCLL